MLARYRFTEALQLMRPHCPNGRLETIEDLPIAVQSKPTGVIVAY